MRRTAGIELVSAAFAAGVGAGALGVNVFSAPWVAAAASVLIIAALFHIGKFQSVASAVLFLALGLVCYCNFVLNEPFYRKISFGTAPLKLFTDAIDTIKFSDPENGALVKALLTGQRNGLSARTVASFRTSGASHILALSGLHLGVIYGILIRILRPLGNSRAAYLCRSALIIAAATFYTVITGAAPSTVRALLFISLNEVFKQLSGRKRNSLSIFCAALTIQLVLSPGSIKSLGFQLSYLAMLGIYLIFPKLDAMYPHHDNALEERIDLVRKTWSSISLTVACQIATAPLVWLRFHTFPKYFLITNLLALPLTELLIISCVSCLTLHLFGISAVDKVCDYLCTALRFCLESIAGM